ncbi:unnamed protein product [Clonostachys chloroleuca]|uniref:Uncharacterized protein n=1 Tax=Clonostachys chloroleuca TaxID=1926264 RepID=A0AA35LUM4_9HYPO|nr:unnamed protein product [Clonostachys chloroleuca]
MTKSEPTTPNQPIPPKESWSNGLLHGLRKKVLHRSSKSQSSFSSSGDQTPTASGSNNTSQSLASPVQATPPISPHQFQHPYPYSPIPPGPPSLRQAEIDRFEGYQQQLPPPTQTNPNGPLSMCFAVDVSGSTRGRVLREEQAAIDELGSALTKGGQFSKDEAWILPWDDRAHSRRPLNGAMSLVSGAGTRPSAVINDAIHKYTLQNSGLWCLMTDGYIDKLEVQSFANAIPRAGIHGTACIIITFGWYQRSPFECNVSVGMSVFAVAPHCLFLYHGIQDSKVYVFQAKGCFEKLLPEDKRFVAFNASTQWRDLHSVSYDEVAQVRVPRPIKLSVDSVLLPSGKTFDMRSIYDNSVSQQDQMDLLADYSSLDVVLLAAKTRGKSAAVRNWAEKARKENESRQPKSINCEDLNGKGTSQLKKLITHITSSDDPDAFWDMLRSEASSNKPQIESLKKELRWQHKVNWDTFENKVREEAELPGKVNMAFDEVLTAISTYETKANQDTPAALTPLSSPMPTSPPFDPNDASDDDDAGTPRLYSNQYVPPPAPTSPNMPRMSPLSPSAGSVFQPYNGFVHPSAMFNPGTGPPVIGPSHPLRSPPLSPSNIPPSSYAMTFLSDFTDPSPPRYPSQNRGQNYNTCLLCGKESSLQTLLLQSNPTTEATRNLPAPNTRSGHRYPLVLGSYAETDIVLPIVCCDGCAFLFLRAGELPNGGGRVAAALPLVPLHVSSNREKWVEALSAVYDHRFSDRIVLLVFLSTLCSTIEDITESDDAGVQRVRESLEWCCRAISRLSGVSTLAGLTPVGSPLTGMIDERMPMQDTIRLAFSNVGIKPTATESPLLGYPIHGFVTLVRLASLFDTIEASEIELFVWKRLCHYLVEQHSHMQARIGVSEANEKLNAFLFDASARNKASVSDGRTARSICHMSDLMSTHLLSQDAVDQFHRMEDYFGVMQSASSNYKNALAVFLHIFNEGLKNQTRVTNAAEFFIQLRYRADKLVLRNGSLNNIVEEPKATDGAMAAASIDLIYKLDELD